MGFSWGDLASPFVNPMDWKYGPNNVLGLQKDAPASAADSEDAKAARGFGSQLREEYKTAGNKQALLVSPRDVNQSVANQARDVSSRNIGRLEGVANGTTPTAANAMLTQGTDQAAARARGIAASYSRSNPGAAMRAGLAASGQAQQAATAQAAMQKAQEQAEARGAIGAQSNAMRAQDLGVATTNQQAQMDAAKANQAADLAANQQNNQLKLGVGQLANQATEMPLKAASEHEKAVTANNASNQQGLGALFAAGGALFSDERTKTNVRPKALVDAYADKIQHGVTYRYKPPYADGGKEEHTGAMANDIEKVVPSAVDRGRDGMRRVDAAEMTMANTGVIAELAERLKRLEERTGKRA